MYKYGEAIFLSILISSPVFAGGWTNWAKSTQIDLERGNGMMVYGDFGNPGSCTNTGRIYIQSSHPDYDRLYSMILAAYMSGKKIKDYSHIYPSLRDPHKYNTNKRVLCYLKFIVL